MRTVLASLFILFAFSARADEIEPGTHVLLRLEHSISTKTAKVGDAVHLRTVNPIPAIPAGSYARGVIVSAKRAGRIHGRAKLEIRIDSITLPNNTVVPIAPGTSSIEAQRVRPSQAQHYPGIQPLHYLGFVAGYGVAAVVARSSNSSETIAGAGLVAGISTVVLLEVLRRGNDLELRQGEAIDVVF